MELGISMFGDLPYDSRTGSFGLPSKRLQEMLEQIKLADEVGLDVFGIGEHHRPDYAVSAPEIVLAAAASVTKNIKLATAVTVLSSTDPVRVFQQFTTLNLISGGRVELAVGRGSFTESFPLFGYDLADYEGLFEQKLDLLLKLTNSSGPVSWKGSLHPSLYNQVVYPRPENPLDIWIASGGSAESIVRAARLGIPLVIAIIGGLPARFAPLFELYRSEYLASGHDPSQMRLATHSHGLIADDGDVLEESYYPAFSAQMDRIGRTRGWSPYSRDQFSHGRKSDGALFVGDPSQVADKIIQHSKMFGLTRFVMHMDIGAPAHSDIMKSIELFGTEVVPRVRKEVGGSVS